MDQLVQGDAATEGGEEAMSLSALARWPSTTRQFRRATAFFLPFFVIALLWRPNGWIDPVLMSGAYVILWLKWRQGQRRLKRRW